MSDTERHPNPIDLHVGRRIRQRRRLLGVTQERLAEDLGLTFQQVQKYERGANRVSASKLYEVARSLRTTIGHFFEGLPEPSDTPIATPIEDDPMAAFAADLGALQVARVWPRLSTRRKRLAAELIEELADDPDPGAALAAAGLEAGHHVAGRA